MNLNLEPEEVNANAEFIFGCIIWALAFVGLCFSAHWIWKWMFA